jgi:hypothetical protein
MDARISNIFGFGATSMSIDIFVGAWGKVLYCIFLGLIVIVPNLGLVSNIQTPKPHDLSCEAFLNYPLIPFYMVSTPNRSTPKP